MTSNLEVLVVDDDPNAGRLLAGMVANGGYVPIWKQTVQESLQYLEQTAAAPGAIILDLMMPDQDGLEMMRVLAKTQRPIPTIIISAKGEEYLDIARSFGAMLNWPIAGTFAKPVAAAELQDCLAKAIGGTATA